jgi:hypothetical protein
MITRIPLPITAEYAIVPSPHNYEIVLAPGDCVAVPVTVDYVILPIPGEPGQFLTVYYDGSYSRSVPIGDREAVAA